MSINKRKLPKAIRRTTDGLRREALAADINPPTEIGAVTPLFAHKGDVVEVASNPPRRVARALASGAPAPTELNAVRRLARARASVEAHRLSSETGILGRECLKASMHGNVFVHLPAFNAVLPEQGGSFDHARVPAALRDFREPMKEIGPSDAFEEVHLRQ